jgi:diketogulonate reductase-like aldo/keto reductase
VRSARHPRDPKSTHRDSLRENPQIFDFELSGEAMRQPDTLDQTGGTGLALKQKWW